MIRWHLRKIKLRLAPGFPTSWIRTRPWTHPRQQTFGQELDHAGPLPVNTHNGLSLSLSFSLSIYIYLSISLSFFLSRSLSLSFSPARALSLFLSLSLSLSLSTCGQDRESVAFIRCDPPQGGSGGDFKNVGQYDEFAERNSESIPRKWIEHSVMPALGREDFIRTSIVIHTRAQRKLLHTWIIVVIVKHHLVQTGQIDGPTECQ